MKYLLCLFIILNLDITSGRKPHKIELPQYDPYSYSHNMRHFEGHRHSFQQDQKRSIRRPPNTVSLSEFYEFFNPAREMKKRLYERMFRQKALPQRPKDEEDAITEVITYMEENPLRRTHIMSLLKFFCRGIGAAYKADDAEGMLRNSFKDLYVRLKIGEEMYDRGLTILSNKMKYCPMFNEWVQKNNVMPDVMLQLASNTITTTRKPYDVLKPTVATKPNDSDFDTSVDYSEDYKDEQKEAAKRDEKKKNSKIAKKDSAGDGATVMKTEDESAEEKLMVGTLKKNDTKRTETDAKTDKDDDFIRDMQNFQSQKLLLNKSSVIQTSNQDRTAAKGLETENKTKVGAFEEKSSPDDDEFIDDEIQGRRIDYEYYEQIEREREKLTTTTEAPPTTVVFKDHYKNILRIAKTGGVKGASKDTSIENEKQPNATFDDAAFDDFDDDDAFTTPNPEPVTTAKIDYDSKNSNISMKMLGNPTSEDTIKEVDGTINSAIENTTQSNDDNEEKSSSSLNQTEKINYENSSMSSEILGKNTSEDMIKINDDTFGRMNNKNASDKQSNNTLQAQQHSNDDVVTDAKQMLLTTPEPKSSTVNQTINNENSSMSMKLLGNTTSEGAIKEDDSVGREIVLSTSGQMDNITKESLKNSSEIPSKSKNSTENEEISTDDNSQARKLLEAKTNNRTEDRPSIKSNGTLDKSIFTQNVVNISEKSTIVKSDKNANATTVTDNADIELERSLDGFTSISSTLETITVSTTEESDETLEFLSRNFPNTTTIKSTYDLLPPST